MTESDVHKKLDAISERFRQIREGEIPTSKMHVERRGDMISVISKRSAIKVSDA